MCFTFFRAQGKEIGSSLVQDEMVDTCRELLAQTKVVQEVPASAHCRRQMRASDLNRLSEAVGMFIAPMGAGRGLGNACG